MDESPIRSIAFVDDHPLVLEALGGMIARMPGCRAVLAASSGEDFIRGMEELPAPDIALVDLSMPGMDGFAVISWLHANRPSVRVMVLTAFFDAQLMRRAFATGACAFLPKSTSLAVLSNAIDEVMTHGGDRVQQEWAGHAIGQVEERALALGIPPRALEMLQHICDGPDMSNEQIAERMRASRHAVDHHRRWFSQRFGIHNRASLVLFAVDKGLASPPEASALEHRESWQMARRAPPPERPGVMDGG
ncbi:MAG: response regulator transcription factor [Flavobacteriales bacterium]|nr:response regulator transcription factor [Flavobacteriales bacterium]